MNTTLKTLAIIGAWLALNPIAYAKQTCNQHITPDTPNERFIENADTVTDKVTTLTWKRCSEGQTWNASAKRCDGTATKYNWIEALTLAKNAGDSWRLPNIKELNSIVERACFKPAINSTIFPDTVSDSYWSSSPYADSHYNAWGVSFASGYDNNGFYKDDSYYVRLVKDTTSYIGNNNHTPTDISISNTSIRKNAGVGRLVANLSTIDADTNDSHRYAIMGGSGANYFEISGNRLLVKNSMSGVNGSFLSVDISTTDNQGGSITKKFYIDLISSPISTERFIKTDGNGQGLPSNTSNWSCVIDNEQGLMWEAKQGGNRTPKDEGLHDADDRFSWGNVNTSTNNNLCYGYDYTDRWCTTDAYIKRVNAKGWCGHNDWRLPTITELAGIINVNETSPSKPKIYSTYFPTLRYWYWSSTESSSRSDGAWTVYFGLGDKGVLQKDSAFQAILVRDYTGNQGGGNQPPTDIIMNTTTVARSTSVNNLVSKLSAVDSDAGDTHTYRIVGGNGSAYFEIKNYNEVRVKSSLSQVTSNTLSLLVRTTDSNGGSYEKELFITLSNTSGSRFIKLDSNGQVLTSNATNWSCTKDTSTGLTWEVKQPAGLHKVRNLTWYNTDTSQNGGYVGDKWRFNSSCQSLFGYCNTESYVNHIRNVGLCGHYDWRLPTRNELTTLVDQGKKSQGIRPVIDRNYFKYSSDYWTSEPTARGNRMMTWVVDLSDGVPTSIQKSSVSYVRLVREN